jgi:quinoprotein dehydrogenase-associated probable ABC transporter substrate-binding protein
MSSRSPKEDLKFQISNLKFSSPHFASSVLLAVCICLSSCARAPRPQAQTPAQPQPQEAQSATAQPHFDRPAGVLRVCADPNNLPFSNERGEGFENKIAELLAADLHERLEYTWWAQRRGFFRNTLRAGACDVVVGVPSSFELAATTAPYYRSTYVFVYRKGRGVSVRSFDDAVLRDVRVGVQLVGDDGANTPPAHALAARGVVQNVRGYTLYGDYSRPSPPGEIVEAVARGDVDVGVVWGPQAGYFARRQRTPLEVVPVSPEIDPPFLPFVYDISMGVRRGDDALLAELESFLERRRPDIERLLDEYGVPRVKKSTED